ncbi:tyrosine-type recombinase/integrase [Candidatus Poribacteria bacterium]|nr:tyrosine-type recombinase/integrase [Candidatus Poribacteria bacterium]MBI3336871.1 tyrosine-type recombinase/integrase [Candidatus Peregrinibacteria bacterium]
MKGARPLSNDEILRVSLEFSGTYSVRNRSLFMLGVSVGGRISELLALTIGDVYQNGQPVKDLLFAKDVVKGKENARMVPVNADGRKAIRDLIDWHRGQYGTLEKERPLFVSRKHLRKVGESSRFCAALSRSQAHRVLEDAFEKAGLNGKLATHTLRKTFAQRCYDQSGDIFQVKELLGHRSVETTKAYIGISYAKLQRTAEAIEVVNYNRTPLLLHSTLTEVPTDTLVIELQRRGYDTSSTITQMQSERAFLSPVLHDEKIIPLERARSAHMTRLRRGQG